MMQQHDPAIVHSYFHRMLGLHWSVHFRGVLDVPDQYVGMVPDPVHVSVAVGYNAFIGRTCCLHSVITRPEAVTRRMVEATFWFPFIACHCEAVLACVDSKNDAAMKFDTKLGFKQIATVPNGGPDGDLNILQMLRSECRWLKRATH